MYSVYNPHGEKIADCGSARDATTLVGMRNAKWDGHYYQYKPDYQTIDLEPFPQNQLPTITISGQELPIQQKLPQSKQEPFIPDFHD